jgi:hypothetical protein
MLYFFLSYRHFVSSFSNIQVFVIIKKNKKKTDTYYDLPIITSPISTNFFSVGLDCGSKGTFQSRSGSISRVYSILLTL